MVVTGISFSLAVFSVGVAAGAVAAAFALGAAGIGWLLGSTVLAGVLAMIVSAMLTLGFGGLSVWAMGVVGLSWAFADTFLGALGMSGATAHVIMAVAYLMLGMTRGKTRQEVLYAGAGPALGLVVGIGLAAAVFPQQVAQGVEEAVLSAAMIAAARSGREYAAILRSSAMADRLLHLAQSGVGVAQVAEGAPLAPASDAPLTIFPTTTKQGRSLAEAIARLGACEGYAVTVAEQATQPEVLAACLGPGVVVFDATIELNDQHNYDIALYALKWVPFALVVSRSYLPTNFLPWVDGGFPTYPRSQTNEEILEWLGQRLHELRDRVPRPARLQGVESMQRLVPMEIKEAKARRRREGAIFISYRGTYEQAVTRLAEVTRRGSGEGVRFFATGELAPPNELMSAQDRWGIMRCINDWLASSAEVWVFWSSDYIASWWTKAELTLIAGQHRHVRSRVRLYDEHTGTTRRLYGVWLANIGRTHRDALTERLLIGRNPEWLSRSDRSTAVPGGLGRYVSSDLTTDRYRDDLIFSCPSCTARATGLPSVRPPRWFVDLLSFDAREVVDMTDPSLQVVSRGVVAASIADGMGAVVCSRCQSALAVREGPPRYWFYPVRVVFDQLLVERGTGPGGIVLERRPVYLLESV